MLRFRPRLTVRGMILLVAAIALGLFAWTEFRDGTPPRFVLRGIPTRIARLRPGMSYEETHAILGLDKPWWLGGTSARRGSGHGGGHWMQETYYLREMAPVVRQASVGGRAPGPVQFWVSSAVIQLRFTTPLPRPGSMFAEPAVRREWTRLVSASFGVDGEGITAEMSPRP